MKKVFVGLPAAARWPAGLPEVAGEARKEGSGDSIMLDKTPPTLMHGNAIFQV